MIFSHNLQQLSKFKKKNFRLKGYIKEKYKRELAKKDK